MARRPRRSRLEANEDQRNRARLKSQMTRARVAVEKAARGNRCEDCGQVYHPFQLDFAHKNEHRHLKTERLKGRRTNKVKSMGDLAYANLEVFLAEIKLCRILCSNCHRMETYRERHFDLDATMDVKDDPQGTLF